MSRGRGRGRGGMSKAALEQLTLSKNEFGKEPLFIPPETFPPLTFHPVKNTAERSEANNYMLMLKKDLYEHFSTSECHISSESKKPDIERYSDMLNILNNNNSRLHFDRSRYPKELWPDDSTSCTNKRKVSKKVQGKVNVKRARVTQIKDDEFENKLNELEKNDVAEDGEKKEEDKEEHIIEEEEEEIDEEMDEGTDYINPYFDNGESYIDDDGDALEEEGIF